MKKRHNFHANNTQSANSWALIKLDNSLKRRQCSKTQKYFLFFLYLFLVKKLASF